MIQKYRKQFNQEFTNEKYTHFNEILKQKSGLETSFRLSESPMFLTNDFKNKLIDASESIISQIKALPEGTLEKAIPENCKVPNDTKQPEFLPEILEFAEAKTAR